MEYRLIPETGYHIAGVGGTCGGTLIGDVFITNPATADCTVIAEFAVNGYTVTPFVDGDYGTVSPDTPQTVVENGTIQFTFTPRKGYRLENVASSCGGSLERNRFTTEGITKDCYVTGYFTESAFPWALFVTVINAAIESKR